MGGVIVVVVNMLWLYIAGMHGGLFTLIVGSIFLMVAATYIKRK